MTVDPALISAGLRAVKQGQASSLSGWVNAALTEHVAKHARLAALAEAITAYEEKFGAMTDSEIDAQLRADKQSAVVVRGPKKKRSAA